MKYLSILLFPLFIACSGETTESTDEANTKYSEGLAIYQRTCVACHQASGEGVEGAFPPLAKSDYLLADKNRAIQQIIKGSTGEMTVNGTVYNSIMPAQELNDEEIKNVMNYILNAWGNSGGEVTLEEVKAQR